MLRSGRSGRCLALAGLLVATTVAPLRADVFIVPRTCAGDRSFGPDFYDIVLHFEVPVNIWCTGSPNFLPNSMFISPPFTTTGLIVNPFNPFPTSGRFGIFSIDIADELFGVNIAGPLTFTGSRGIGLPPVTQTFQFTPEPGAPAFTRFFFNADFADLQSLSFPVQGLVGGSAPIYQFGNITYSLVPEPSTVALLATGLVGVGFFARKRRSNF